MIKRWSKQFKLCSYFVKFCFYSDFHGSRFMVTDFNAQSTDIWIILSHGNCYCLSTIIIENVQKSVTINQHNQHANYNQVFTPKEEQKINDGNGKGEIIIIKESKVRTFFCWYFLEYQIDWCWLFTLINREKNCLSLVNCDLILMIVKK